MGCGTVAAETPCLIPTPQDHRSESRQASISIVRELVDFPAAEGGSTAFGADGAVGTPSRRITSWTASRATLTEVLVLGNDQVESWRGTLRCGVAKYSGERKFVDVVFWYKFSIGLFVERWLVRRKHCSECWCQVCCCSKGRA